MTPAQSMALSDIDEYRDSGYLAPTSSSSAAPARRVQPSMAGLERALLWIESRSAHNVTASSSTAEPSKTEGAEPPSPPPVVPAKQPEYAAQSTPASQVTQPGLAGAATMDDVLAVLRESGLVALADRVAELHRRHEADPEEHPLPNTASLKRMAQAVLTNARLRTPNRLAVNDEGFFTAEWTVGQAELVLSFWPSSHIRFAALDPIDIRGSHLRVGGLLNSSDAVNAVRWLVSRIPT